MKLKNTPRCGVFFMPYAGKYRRGDIMNAGKNADLTLGLGMALMQNTDAFLYFSALEAEQQHRIIEQSKQLKSRKEMKSFVDNLKASN